jgi:hypothetical protein
MKKQIESLDPVLQVLSGTEMKETEGGLIGFPFPDPPFPLRPINICRFFPKVCEHGKNKPQPGGGGRITVR